MEKINIDSREFGEDQAARELVDFMSNNETALCLTDAVLHYDFPIYRNDDGELVTTKMLIVSPHHGFILIATRNATREDEAKALSATDAQLDTAFSCLYSRLLRNPRLRKTRTDLIVPHAAFIYAPFLQHDPPPDLQGDIVRNHPALNAALAPKAEPPLDETIVAEMLSTLEGAKGLIRPKTRDLANTPAQSKGRIAAEIESAIASFDLQQKQAYVSAPTGVERIRGLAGSGKTVILAMKAALTHLRYPEANIVYTFYTKSLYQHIQRLITRFYRQFYEQDPNWERLRIMHGWGGKANPGVYSTACEINGIRPLTFRDAAASPVHDRFDYVCTQLLNNVKVQPVYDFVFLDEGQDFPASFIRLCTRLAKENRLAWAYDDLQTIFQPMTPTPSEVFGANEHGEPVLRLSRDIVLYKCYRNPREILLCAHALGFGLYGTRIVQMLENAQHWEDLGYRVVDGEFEEGSQIVIERPKEYSLELSSKYDPPSEIVKADVLDSFDSEVKYVVQAIENNLQDGLRPDDILVICVDDRHAKDYLRLIAHGLGREEVRVNDIHTDVFGLIDFYREGRITLSTVYKAKGNEAFVVYVVGVDALFSPYPSVQERNMLFTALTRAKGWVRVSGVGAGAERCKAEITLALKNYPHLRFTYPSKEQLKVMRRDLAADAIRKQQAQRLMERLYTEYGISAEDMRRFVEDRQGANKKKRLKWRRE